MVENKPANEFSRHPADAKISNGPQGYSYSSGGRSALLAPFPRRHSPAIGKGELSPENYRRVGRAGDVARKDCTSELS
jgi:hypothetical protein